MRTTRVLAVSAVAAAVLGAAAPTATAWDHPSNIVALPGVIARGGELTLTVDGCSKGGSAMSPAFRDEVELSSVQGSRNESASGTAKVKDSAVPGTYDVKVDCGGTGALTRPSAFTVIGGVRGGLGGSSATGATPTDVAIGGGLVAVALIGGGAFWLRRRTESRL